MIINMVIYLIISICGYLCSPNDVVDIIIERKRLWYKDISMTVSRIIIIPFAINKIQINYTFLKNSLFNKDNEDINIYHNIIFTLIIFIITTSLSSIYQSIVTYISIIGSFFVVIPAFLLPPIIKKYILEDKDRKTKCEFIFGLFLCIIGYFSGILKIIDIAQKHEKI